MDENLINYIKQCREQNISDEEIRTNLLNAGWKEEDINLRLNPLNVPQAPKTVSNGKLPSAFAILKDSFLVFKSKFWGFLLLALVPVILAMILGIVMTGGAMALTLASFGGGIGGRILVMILVAVIIMILFTIIQLWSQAVLIFATKAAYENIGFKGILKKGWKSIKSFLCISALMSLIVATGGVLFIVPGILFVIWYVFSVYVFAEEGLRGLSALARSKEYVKGRWWGVFGRWIFIIAFVVLVSFVGGLISGLIDIAWVSLLINFLIAIFVGPLILIYNYITYKRLKELKTITTAPNVKFEKMFVRIGIIVLLLLIIGSLVFTFVLVKKGTNTIQNNAQSRARDAMRASEINRAIFMLETNHKTGNVYPTTGGCMKLGMSKFLDISLDPINSGEYVYQYSGDGQKYVFKAVFESQNTMLDYDLDGNIMGCNCDDPAYCVSNEEQ